MTLIEFFDKEPMENICSCITNEANRVIFLGDSLKQMKKHVEWYKSILSARRIQIEFVCKCVQKNKLQPIIDVLSDIVEQYEDCVFDLTGGEDLYLVAMGIVFEKYKDRNIQMHRYNIRNNEVVDVDQDGNVISPDENKGFTIDECIKMHGGRIVYDAGENTNRWLIDDDFRDDINHMWKLCNESTIIWNKQIEAFQKAEKIDDSEKGKTLCVKKKGFNQRIVEDLYSFGLLTNYSLGKDCFYFSFKNKQIEKCLTKVGQVLEMKIYLAAAESLEQDESKSYFDVANGVFIDWDGNDSNHQGTDIVNEIDVVMMHKMIPVFVSCKSGHVDMNELYKLNAVATKFGGKYVKKVLVATSLDHSIQSGFIRERASEMGIRLVEGYSKNGNNINLGHLNDVEINRIVRSLWSN